VNAVSVSIISPIAFQKRQPRKVTSDPFLNDGGLLQCGFCNNLNNLFIVQGLFAIHDLQFGISIFTKVHSPRIQTLRAVFNLDPFDLPQY
jgi:hypothetical protein